MFYNKNTSICLPLPPAKQPGNRNKPHPEKEHRTWLRARKCHSSLWIGHSRSNSGHAWGQLCRSSRQRSNPVGGHGLSPGGSHVQSPSARRYRLLLVWEARTGVSWRAVVSYQVPRHERPRGKRIRGLGLSEKAGASTGRGRSNRETWEYSGWDKLIPTHGVTGVKAALWSQGFDLLAVLWAVLKALLSMWQRESGYSKEIFVYCL